jgi:hypothetical protein
MSLKVSHRVWRQGRSRRGSRESSARALTFRNAFSSVPPSGNRPRSSNERTSPSTIVSIRLRISSASSLWTDAAPASSGAMCTSKRWRVDGERPKCFRESLICAQREAVNQLKRGSKARTPAHTFDPGSSIHRTSECIVLVLSAPSARASRAC